MKKKIPVKDLLDPKKTELYQEELLQYFEKGGTWKDLLGMSEEAIESQYKVAYDFYQNREFQKALDSFSYLTVVNPYEYLYWLGLGMARQSLSKFEEAVVAYTVAEAVSDDNPEPHLLLAQCFSVLEQDYLVKEHLEKTIEKAKGHPEHQELAEKAQAILNQAR